MIVVPKFVDFLNRVVTLTDYEFENVDLIPDTLCGTFSSDRFKELIYYCAEHEEFHIISIKRGGIYFNKPIAGADSYCLGRGDSNPKLVFIDY